MATTEILPFALDPLAVVLPQDEYEALPARHGGFRDGVALPAHLNKVWRQSSFVSAAVAQFVAEQSETDVRDDGQVDALVEQMTQAVSHAVPLATVVAPGRVQLATTPETLEGTDAEHAVTPTGLKAALEARTVPDATYTTSGIIELATTQETLAGTDTTRAVTPAGVKAALDSQTVGLATEASPGIVELASMAETLAGTDRVRAVTPAGVLACVLQAIPPGMVASFARATRPEGWLVCDGSKISRSTYAALFTAIGTTFGAGDGATTFTLPDLRGEFVRGWDNGRGADAGRAFGGAQGDALQNINGTMGRFFGYTSSESGALFASEVSASGVVLNTANHIKTINFDASRVARTAAETRPRNLALLYCIKF